MNRIIEEMICLIFMFVYFILFMVAKYGLGLDDIVIISIGLSTLMFKIDRNNNIRKK